MTDAARQLLNRVLALASQDREWIATELLASLDGPADVGWEAAWSDELARRQEAAQSCGESGAAWDGVRAEILARLENP
ncbi:MAG: addiction module protein [Planctomycetota bacterium]